MRLVIALAGALLIAISASAVETAPPILLSIHEQIPEMKVVPSQKKTLIKQAASSVASWTAEICIDLLLRHK